MNDTARVVRLHAIRDIRIEEMPAPAPGPGEVRLSMARGGICGSDLHYFSHGGVGPIRVREPIVLGHEAAGVVEAAGPGTDLAPGTLVAVSPSMACGTCDRCAAGRPRHCRHMRFMGSAMFLPHEQGLYRSAITVPAAQCLALPPGTDPSAAACCEPLAVCLHALARVPGGVAGKRVLITGAGPIGSLCAAVARDAGAARVTVTDIQDAPLAIASRMGADLCLNTATAPGALADLPPFDVCLECSGAAPAIAAAIAALEPGGTLVQVGLASEVAIPLGSLVAREIALIGTFRFDHEFAAAAEAIGTGRIDVTPILTGAFPLAQAQAALETALDRTSSCKVMIDLSA